MSTYCISDIHGYKSAFDAMLDKIAFSPSDDLWILGDIDDRGPESGEMTVWAVEDAPSNVHFLLGNHDEMMMSAIRATQEGCAPVPNASACWYGNGGIRTWTGINEIVGDSSWWHERLLPWLEKLVPYEIGVEVKGQKFALVHAGFDPSRFNDGHDRRTPMLVDFNSDDNALSKTYDCGKNFGYQFCQDLMWIRLQWLFDPYEAPMETVFGHTFIPEKVIDKMLDKGIGFPSGGGGKIAHFENKHGIDCGCANASRGEEGMNLGCLRLDDMEEFYVPIEPTKWW